MERIEKSLFVLFVRSFFLFLLFFVILLISPQKWIQITFLFFTALFIVFGFTYLFARILIKVGLLDSDLDGIIRESDWYPSLSRIQFFLWTLLIGIVFVWFLLLKILYFLQHNNCPVGISEIDLPEGILTLLGITSFTTVASKGLSSFKYGKRYKPAKLPSLGTVFLENQIPSLARYQMFLWTCIGILMYFVLVVTTVHNSFTTGSNCTDTSNDCSCLPKILPDIPMVLVFLMGISQATYLSGKYVSTPTNARITLIIPVQGTIGRPVIIHGTNFGPKGKGTVLFNKTDVEYSDWTDDMIKINHLPQIDIDPNNNMCEIRVVTASETTLPYEYEINP